MSDLKQLALPIVKNKSGLNNKLQVQQIGVSGKYIMIKLCYRLQETLQKLVPYNTW